MCVSSGGILSVDYISEAGGADAVRDALETLVKDKRVLVFVGFSGRGYADESGVRLLMESTLKEQLDKYGADSLVVVAGATDEGVGEVYKVAHDLGLKTLGIVSKQLKQLACSDSSKYCDHVVYVDAPDKRWEVLSPEGSSYMVTVSQMGNGGEMFFIGGGEVACSELQEALNLGVSVQIHKDFLPRSSDAPAPLRDWCNANPVAFQRANT